MERTTYNIHTLRHNVVEKLEMECLFQAQTLNFITVNAMQFQLVPFYVKSI